MQNREQYVIELQGEMLRIDYEYGLIVKDLKNKYSDLAKQLQTYVLVNKQIKRDNKRLVSALESKDREIQQLKSKIQDEKLKTGFQEENVKRSKQENQNLRNQIRHLQANQSKNNLKVQQSNKKKQQIQQQYAKLQQKYQNLQKQYKKSQQKRKQLEELIQQQVLSTQQRVRNIGLQLSSTKFIQTKMNNQQIRVRDQFQKTVSLHNPETTLNDWQSDMKKLKNCIDYGSSYVLVFDPMNLDRNISRQIFKFVKKCLNQKNDMELEIKSLNESHSKALATYKETLSHFEVELSKISQLNSTKLTVDTLCQTEHLNAQQRQKIVVQMSELNTKMKIKNSMLLECIEMFALRNVKLHEMISWAHLNLSYQKNLKKDNIKMAKKKCRSAFLTVLFVQILKKKAKNTARKSQQFNSSNFSQSEFSKRLQIQTLKLKSKQIKNPELEKLRQTLLIPRQQLFGITQQIISYYQFKLTKNIPQISYFQ